MIGNGDWEEKLKRQQRPADLVPAKPDVMGSYGGLTRLSRMEHEATADAWPLVWLCVEDKRR